MLILMSLESPRQDIEKVKQKIISLNCTPHEIPGTSKLAIGITGPTDKLTKEDFQLLSSVEEVIRVTKKYKLVSRMMKSEDTIINVNGTEIGGKELFIIAGPCAVESRDQIFDIAGRLKEMGIKFLRAGAYKPRSSPYAFQGLKEKGLEYLSDVKKEIGINIVTEVLNQSTISVVAEVADIIQLGARNMQNFALLEEVGKTQKPILLKRGMSATIEELLLSAEYIVTQNNYNIILCERGIRTFETATRNTLDLNAVPVIKKNSHLPIIVDPSHGIGIWDKVPAMSMASIAAGADGLIIEVHTHPEKALSDGYQTLNLATFKELLNKLQELAPVVNKKLTLRKMNNYNFPDSNGKFGQYGGRFVPETLMSALNELESTYAKLKNDPAFISEYEQLQKEYNGRPTPLTFARRLTEHFGKAKIYLKREDLCHTGAHKLNNAIGQILIAKKLGKKRIIAETGAGQHGVATATVCAKFGLQCVVYMGETDIERQKPNVFRMQLLGAEVRPVSSGSKTLKDATNEAIRDWVTNVEDTHYIIGSVVGPHPYPLIVRDFQSIIGTETKGQILAVENKLADYIVACVGGGSNAIGMFHPFINDKDVSLIGVEAAGLGIESDKHCATLTLGEPGIFQGMNTYLLQDENGQVAEVHSISAGLDYPGVGPEHSLLKDIERVKYFSITDDEALNAVHNLTRLEGILPALESAHAVAYLEKFMDKTNPDEIVVVNISGRGDKDLATIISQLGK